VKRIAVLGSTGSVGQNALSVIESRPDSFKVEALTAWTNHRDLAEQSKRHRPGLVAVADDTTARNFCRESGFPRQKVEIGPAGLLKAATLPEAEVVLVAVAGAAALEPAFEAAKAGKTLALANKECLVMAGELIMGAAAKSGAAVLPVDSEHAGIFQALAGRPVDEVSRVILPASGGPLLDLELSELDRVTPQQALAHPTWNMGKKISIDSATLMNKALEVIEAARLFGLPGEKIEVVIHPQSIVHAMVEFIDGSMVAQMSKPDMRLPIMHALAWPERMEAGIAKLALSELSGLTFREVDPERFPSPGLAYKALEAGGTMPAVMAAADEAAVEMFLAGKIMFSRIVELAAEVMQEHEPGPCGSIEAAREADRWARQAAARMA